MKRLSYFIENTNKLDEALITITSMLPCFIEREYVEMNFSEITITVREEDSATVERLLAALV